MVPIAQENAGWLYVAMHDSLLVSIMQSRAELRNKLDDQRQGQVRAIRSTISQEVFQRLSLYKLCRAVQQLLSGTIFEERLDVFVVTTKDLFYLGREMLMKTSHIGESRPENTQHYIISTLSCGASAIGFYYPFSPQRLQQEIVPNHHPG
jgi:hypothetical protein